MKKILAIVIAALTVLTVVPFAVLAAPVTATANWLTDNVNNAGDTFTIDDVEDLYAFLTVVDTFDFTGKTVKLTADITVPDGAWDYTEWPQWFAGTFDGQNHTITNFKGFLFYRLSIGGTLKNVTFKNWSSLAKSSDTSKRAAYLINIAYKNSNVTNVTVDNTASTNLLDGISLINTCLGNVTGVTVLGGTYLNSSVANSAGLGTKFTNIYSNATINQSTNDGWGDCGGIVNKVENNSGQLNTNPVLFDTCWFDGTVTIPGNGSKWAGGILSTATNATVAAKMLNCLNTGVITCGGDMGGLAGGLYGDGSGSVAQITFEKSASLGRVQGAAGSLAASSFIHYVGYTGRKAAVSFTDCYALTGSALCIQPGRVVEGLATVTGTITELDGTPAKYETALQTLTDWSTLQLAGDKTIIVPTYFKTAGIVKDVITNITIADADDWKAFLEDADNTYEGVTVKLTADIDVSAVTGVGPIKDFKGTLDGQGFKLTKVSTQLFTTLTGVLKNIDLDLNYQAVVGDTIETLNGTVSDVIVTGYLFVGGKSDAATQTDNAFIETVNGTVKNVTFSNLQSSCSAGGRYIDVINAGSNVDGITVVGLTDAGHNAYAHAAIGDIQADAVVKNVLFKDFTRTEIFNLYGTVENLTIDNCADIGIRYPRSTGLVKNLVFKNMDNNVVGTVKAYTINHTPECDAGFTIDGLTVDSTCTAPLIYGDGYLHANMTIKNMVVNNGAATYFGEVKGTIDGITVNGNTVSVIGSVAATGSVDTSKITINNSSAPVIANPAWPAPVVTTTAATTTAAATTAAATTTAATTTAATTTAAATTAAGTTAAATTAAATTAAGTTSSTAASSSSVAATGSSAIASSSSAAATSSSVETGDASFTLFVIAAILLSAAAFAVVSKARS